MLGSLCLQLHEIKIKKSLPKVERDQPKPPAKKAKKTHTHAAAASHKEMLAPSARKAARGARGVILYSAAIVANPK